MYKIKNKIVSRQQN